MPTKDEKTDFWKLLGVFQNEVRVEIIKTLLQFEWRSLSDIANKLEKEFHYKMSLPGVLKHMKELENAGIIRHESGIYADKPDARKTIYILEGKDRIQKILNQLENVTYYLMTGVIFNQTSQLARKLQGTSSKFTREEKETFKSLLAKCESDNVFSRLTEDERKKLKVWKMLLAVEE
jgi:predicted transcriptional regulator